MKLGYTYRLVPTEPEVFGDPGDEMSGSELRDEVTLWRYWWGGLGVFDARAVGPDGSAYVIAWPRVLRVVGNGGQLVTAAGGGTDTLADGMPAVDVRLFQPEGLDVGPDGIVSTVAGTGDAGFRGDLGPAGRAWLDVLAGLAVDPDGRVIVAEWSSSRLRRVRPAIQGLSADGEYTFPSEDGAELYIFGADGRHLRTLHSLTGATLWIFGYDDLGFIARDEDPTGAAKTLTREERPEQGGFTTLLTTAEGRMTAYDVRRLPEGGRVHSNTFPSGVIHRTRYAKDGSEQAEMGDGRVIASEQAGDPRFGVQVKRTGLASLATPGGLLLEYQASREVQGGKAGEPLTFFGLRTEETVNGKTWVTGYSRDSRRFETQSPEGRQEWTTLDEAGRVVRREWPGTDLYPVRLEYDAHGRLLRVLQGEGGEERVVSLGWATDGQLASLVDPLGRTTSFERDANGRVTRQVLPDGRAIGLGWDAHGNATSVTPPGRPVHGMAYTPVDLLESYDPPAVAGVPEDRTRYAFDRDRALVRVTRPDGGLVDIALDAGGRVDVLTHPDGQVDFDYAAHSGLPQQITTSEGVSLQLSWDGILPLEEILSGPFSLSIVRSYSNDLQLESLSVGGQASVGYVHDQDGLLTEAGSLYLYRDPSTGRLTGTELDQVTTSLAYDGFGAPAAFEAGAFGESLFSVDYGRDMLGRIVRKDETIQGETHSFEYGYDPAGRLVEVIEDGTTTTTYEFDSNGNRLRLMSSDGTDLAGTYDDQDRMLSHGEATYRYTAAGELQSKTEGAEVTTYRYDALGNLRQVTLPDGREIAYLVDGRNRRVAKLVDGVMERGWVWMDQLKPLAEVDGNGDILSEFVYAGGVNVPEYMLQGGEVFRLVKDHLGSVRLVVNAATGEVAQRLDFGPWGEVLLDTNPGFQPFGFAGGLYDPDTGLVRFGARDYDPEAGRWTAKDPILFSGGDANLYGYSAVDPGNRMDATGARVELRWGPIDDTFGWLLHMAGYDHYWIATDQWPLGRGVVPSYSDSTMAVWIDAVSFGQKRVVSGSIEIPATAGQEACVDRLIWDWDHPGPYSPGTIDCNAYAHAVLATCIWNPNLMRIAHDIGFPFGLDWF